MAKTLFDIPDNETCSIFDATYRLTQKSKNYAGQKQLWSEKILLIKPITITYNYTPVSVTRNL